MMLGYSYCRALALVFLAGLACGPDGIQSVSFSVLPHRYDCGEHSMQLLVLPTPNLNVRFKVVDEFGTAFEVTNCSICLHWVTSNEDGVVLSAGYRGCHVQYKSGRNHLKVRVEELDRSRRVAAFQDINMVCPKPEGRISTTEDGMRHMPQPPMPGRVHPLPAQPQPPVPGRVHPLPAQPQPSQVHPLPAQPQPPMPSQVRPLPAQPQPLMPGQVRPLPAQPQPGWVRPLPAQPQPPVSGRVHPLPAQPQPGQVRPLPAQPQPPMPGRVRPLPAQPQPGLVRPLPHLYPPIYNIGTHLTMEQCRVLGSKIPCADTYDQATCHQASCCYDDSDLNTPCYYGNTVTVQCLKEGHFVLVVSRDMSDYPVVLDTVKLSYAQAGCDPFRRTEAFLVFRFPLTQCGTTVQVIGDKLIYENQLISGIDIQNGPGGAITRDSTFILHARCVYNATDFLPVRAEVLLPPTPAPVSQMGPLRLELRIATDASYKAYYLDGDYPVVKALRDPVYVEVRILQRTDPSLVLVLHDCWATPSANPLEQLQWPVLVDGCPFEGDNYRTQRGPPGPASPELPFPTHYQRFTISTFRFVDSGSQVLLSQLVYLFCSASACYSSQFEPCRTCSARSSRGRRFLNPLNRTEPVDLASSHGPVIFPETKQPASNGSEIQTDFNSVVLGLLSVATVSSVVVLLTVLWRWNHKSSCLFSVAEM